MTLSIMEILGGEKHDFERKVPGLETNVNRSFIYVGPIENQELDTLFRKLLDSTDLKTPSSGGAMEEKCLVKLPSKDLFFAISYKGDLKGWRELIINGATTLGLIHADVVDGTLIFSSGKSVSLLKCEAKFL